MQKLLRIKILYFILGATIFGGLGTAFAYSIFASDVGFTPVDNNWEVNNTGSALDDLHETCGFCKSKFEGLEWGFAYENKEQVFTAPLTGLYVLETWGAQGGDANSTYIGGYGAYAIGTKVLQKGDKLYINVGAKGGTASKNTSITGGYNGGGNAGGGWTSSNSTEYMGAGGGATHIALETGLLSTFENKKDKVLMVSAGGSGGSYFYRPSDGNYSYCYGAHAGGIEGQISSCTQNTPSTTATVPTQTSTSTARYGSDPAFTSSFGQGIGNYSGGGGGWYGGAGTHGISTSGSSYIGSTDLKSINTIEKHITCYGCTISDVEDTKTTITAEASSDAISDKAKMGNGYVRITILTVN